MLAAFQSSGIIPVSNEHWKIILKIGAMAELVSFKTLAPMWSGPVALFTLRSLSSLSILEEEIAISSISGWGLDPLSGKFCRFSTVKTDLK